MSQSDRPANAGQGVFISYRRSDCLPQANGLYGGLETRLPGSRIFMDIDSIPAGVDFEEHIRREIDGCSVVLVMIGDNWLDVREGTNTRRIDEANDFVRLEVESALANPKVVTIPVLVEGAQMPAPEDLPESIRRLARINAFELDDRRWKADVEGLAKRLEEIEGKAKPTARPQAAASPPPPPPAPQQYGAAQMRPAQAYAAPVPQTPASWRPPAASAPANSTPTDSKKLWLITLLPMLSCGLLTVVPFVRSAKLRPTQRAFLLQVGVGLQVAALIGGGLIVAAPTDAEGSPTGVMSNMGAGIVLLVALTACVLAYMYRDPIRVDLNRMTAAAIAKGADIPLEDAQLVVAQRSIVGRFTSVEQALMSAELPPASAWKLRDIANV